MRQVPSQFPRSQLVNREEAVGDESAPEEPTRQS